MSNTISEVPRRLNLPRKLPKTAAEVPSYIKPLVDALNDQNSKIAVTMTAMLGADVLANRPEPQQNGWLFYATDVSHLYVASNSTWIMVV